MTLVVGGPRDGEQESFDSHWLRVPLPVKSPYVPNDYIDVRIAAGLEPLPPIPVYEYTRSRFFCFGEVYEVWVPSGHGKENRDACRYILSVVIVITLMAQIPIVHYEDDWLPS